jgi:glyoxylase-like metal-dependent hydrolase (beta-lactamase superfamily II)
MEAAQGVHRLTQGVSNFYLIEEAGKFTLADTGTPGDWGSFCPSLSSLGKLADVDAVLLSHAHPDHTGFAGRARTAAPARAWIHQAHALVTRNPFTDRAGPPIMPSGLNEDTPQALRSLDVLQPMTAGTLLPGHGDPWTRGATEAVTQAKAAGPS